MRGPARLAGRRSRIIRARGLCVCDPLPPRCGGRLRVITTTLPVEGIPAFWALGALLTFLWGFVWLFTCGVVAGPP